MVVRGDSDFPRGGGVLDEETGALCTNICTPRVGWPGDGGGAAPFDTLYTG